MGNWQHDSLLQWLNTVGKLFFLPLISYFCLSQPFFLLEKGIKIHSHINDFFFYWKVHKWNRLKPCYNPGQFCTTLKLCYSVPFPQKMILNGLQDVILWRWCVLASLNGHAYTVDKIMRFDLCTVSQRENIHCHPFPTTPVENLKGYQSYQYQIFIQCQSILNRLGVTVRPLSAICRSTPLWTCHCNSALLTRNIYSVQSMPGFLPVWARLFKTF